MQTRIMGNHTIIIIMKKSKSVTSSRDHFHTVSASYNASDMSNRYTVERAINRVFSAKLNMRSVFCIYEQHVGMSAVSLACYCRNTKRTSSLRCFG